MAGMSNPPKLDYRSPEPNSPRYEWRIALWLLLALALALTADSLFMSRFDRWRSLSIRRNDFENILPA